MRGQNRRHAARIMVLRVLLAPAATIVATVPVAAQVAAQVAGSASASAAGQQSPAAAAGQQAPARAAPGASVPATSVAGGDESVIVTGTREPHKKARDSLAPIDVVTASEIARTGQTNLVDALAQLLPSVTRPAEGNFEGSPTDFLSLRGLNPDQTLVLVNGKRRHPTADIYIGGFADSSTPVDLDLIPPDLIDHVEILRDGAAAQYGSDAIAGVINVILKSSDHGGVVDGELGQYDRSDGFTADAGGETSVSLGGRGFIDLSVDYRHHDHTDRDGPDDRTGTDVTKILGDPESTRYAFGMNAGYTLPGDIELYSFDSYAYRFTSVNQLFRLPTSLPQVYPGGFTPHETTFENDGSAALGIKGPDLLGWNWDLSATWGADYLDDDLRNSANAAVYLATGQTPLAFHLANLSNQQLTDDFDVNRSFELPLLAFPFTIAAGLEHRFETYGAGVGSPDSYALGGSSAQAGLLPSNAGPHSRVVYSAYVDLSTKITQAWQVDVAGRFEHYTDFGDTYDGKISSRYDISPRVALRGTLSNGTRAPSLADEFYSALAVGPDNATGTLAANSAGARLLGASPLKPERSTNITAGVVLQPIDHLNVVIDAYQIDIRDRIVSGQAVAGDTAIEALQLQGIAVSPSLTAADVATSFFTNGASTRTRGVDMTASYLSHFGRFGTVTWDASMNATFSRITHTNTTGQGLSDLTDQSVAYLTTNIPKNRIIVGGRWQLGRWDLLLHEQRFGQTIDALEYFDGPNAYSPTTFFRFYNRPRWLTNLEVGFRPFKRLRVALGANNLFDSYPSRIPPINGFYGAELYDIDANQIGIDGGFYYLKAGYSF